MSTITRKRLFSASERFRANANPALLYSGQFLLGPSFAGHLESWRQVHIDESLKLTLHPTLDTVQVSEGDKSLTLVGFMLDPFNPAAQDKEILERLLKKFTSIDKLINATFGLGGRWLLIAKNGIEKWLFHDALGLRQAFYTNPEIVGSLYVMSQPGIAAEFIDLVPDPEALSYADSYLFRSNPEYKWPGAASPHVGLHHLLPNHYLDLVKGTCKRYWPDRPLENLDVDRAVSEIAVLLPGLIRAAANRFELALGITAGLDSRLVLAACRQIKQDVSYVSVRQAAMPDDATDILVPGKLLAKLGLKHDVIKAAANMTPEFSRIYRQNAFLAHQHYGADVEAILNHFGRRRVALTGSGSEVGRCPFRYWVPFSRNVRPTSRYLSDLEFNGVHPFITRHLDEWLNGASEFYGINVRDLF